MGMGAAFPYPGDRAAPTAVQPRHREDIGGPNGVGAMTGCMRAKATGFTLLELMVVLAVLTLMIGIGFPAMGTALDRARIANTHHLLTASLMAARATAVTRGSPVTLCPSSDGRHCRRDRAWEQGWIMFADPRRTGEPASASQVLRRVDGLSGDFLLRTTEGRPRVRFLPNGRAWGSNVSFTLCGGAPRRLLGKVVVNNSGRARSQRPRSEVDCPYTQ